SKSALYETIVETLSDQLLERVAGALPGDPDAPRLRPGLDAYLGFLAERPAAWRLLVRDPPADPALIRVHERLASQRLAALADMVASPAKRAGSGAHIELVSAAIRAFAAWWYEHREIPQEQVSQAIL